MNTDGQILQSIFKNTIRSYTLVELASRQQYIGSTYK